MYLIWRIFLYTSILSINIKKSPGTKANVPGFAMISLTIVLRMGI